MNKYSLANLVFKIGNILETTNNANDRPNLDKLLSSAGYLMSKIELNKEIKESISSFDRLLSELWIENKYHYEEIYSEWNKFKENY